MGRLLARRFVTMVLLVFGISVVSFVIIELPRGDFVSYHVLTLKAAGFEMAPEQVSNLRAQFGLDKPWYHRYLRWIGGIVLRGDSAGRSSTTSRSRSSSGAGWASPR